MSIVAGIRLNVALAVSALAVMLVCAFLYLDVRFDRMDARLEAIQHNQLQILANQEEMLANLKEMQAVQEEMLRRLPPLPAGQSPVYYPVVYPDYPVEYPLLLSAQ